MTTSETLRHAATQIRDQHGPDHPRRVMWLAVAAWLDREAQRRDDGWRVPDATAVADAYLKSAATS